MPLAWWYTPLLALGCSAFAGEISELLARGQAYEVDQLAKDPNPAAFVQPIGLWLEKGAPVEGRERDENTLGAAMHVLAAAGVASVELAPVVARYLVEARKDEDGLRLYCARALRRMGVAGLEAAKKILEDHKKEQLKAEIAIAQEFGSDAAPLVPLFGKILSANRQEKETTRYMLAALSQIPAGIDPIVDLLIEFESWEGAREPSTNPVKIIIGGTQDIEKIRKHVLRWMKDPLFCRIDYLEEMIVGLEPNKELVEATLARMEWMLKNPPDNYGDFPLSGTVEELALIQAPSAEKFLRSVADGTYAIPKQELEDASADARGEALLGLARLRISYDKLKPLLLDAWDSDSDLRRTHALQTLLEIATPQQLAEWKDKLHAQLNKFGQKQEAASKDAAAQMANLKVRVQATEKQLEDPNLNPREQYEILKVKKEAEGKMAALKKDEATREKAKAPLQEQLLNLWAHAALALTGDEPDEHANAGWRIFANANPKLDFEISYFGFFALARFPKVNEAIVKAAKDQLASDKAPRRDGLWLGLLAAWKDDRDQRLAELVKMAEGIDSCSAGLEGLLLSRAASPELLAACQRLQKEGRNLRQRSYSAVLARQIERLLKMGKQ